MNQEGKTIKIRWAWATLRVWLKKNCLDVETIKLGDMRYCLEKYFELIGEKKPNKKSTLILLEEYNDVRSPIFKGIKTPKVSLKRESKKVRRKKYDAYLKSARWKKFKATIIEMRGNTCERCRGNIGFLELHHKTYARIFNELPQDVELLCRSCHQAAHGS